MMIGFSLLLHKRSVLVVSIILLMNVVFVLDLPRKILQKIIILQQGTYKLNTMQSMKSRTRKSVLTTRGHSSQEGRRLLQDIEFHGIKVHNESDCNDKRFLVYKCDSTSLCGGLGDRQKGIVSVFLMALLSDRIFIIDVTHPCKMEDVQLPNVYNWANCKSHIDGIPVAEIEEVNYIDENGTSFINGIQRFSFDKNWKKQVIYLRFNAYAIDGIRQHELATTKLSWLMNIPNEEVIHLVLHTLFQPSKRILKDAGDFYDSHKRQKYLVCSHIRIGKNPTISRDDTLQYGKPNETVIFNFLERFDMDNSYAIYIASDSNDVKLAAKRHLKSYIDINRTIVHIDRFGQYSLSKTEACEGFYTALFEQYILSFCDTLVLTRSGFGTMAAYIRGISDGLFLYHPKTHKIIETNLTNIQKVFKHV